MTTEKSNLLQEYRTNSNVELKLMLDHDKMFERVLNTNLGSCPNILAHKKILGVIYFPTCNVSKGCLK